MMAHNRYRNHLTEGDQEAAERDRQHRNQSRAKYEKAKKEFNKTQREERKLDQIMANSETQWELVNKLKNQRRRGK